MRGFLKPVSHGAQAWSEVQTVHLLDQQAMSATMSSGGVVPLGLRDSWEYAEM